MSADSSPRPRARDLGVVVGALPPGAGNAITDVEGVRVGHATLIADDGGPAHAVRTGVTVVLPHGGRVYEEPVFGGHAWLNGNGELTGTAWLAENGMVASPIALTSTASVGVVRDALVAQEVAEGSGPMWSLPIVGETWDGFLHDINGQHVRAEHALAAYATAADGPVQEGNVGGGTGMISFGFKAGIGTASRLVQVGPDGRFTVGVLVQSNFGLRRRLTVLGVPVGEIIDAGAVPLPSVAAPERLGSGSIIALVATDAPLSPLQCTRLAKRAGLAVGRAGGAGEDSSGDGMLAWSTAAAGTIPAGDAPAASAIYTVDVVADGCLDPLFEAAIEATEEAILNAMLAARTMRGVGDAVAHELPHEPLIRALASRGAMT